MSVAAGRPSADTPPDRDGLARLENGWGRLTFDLFRAHYWHIGGYKGIVLEAILEASWWLPWLERRPGDPPPEPVPVRLNISELARQTGLHQSALNSAKRQLIHEGVLTEQEDGTILPHKQYLDWDVHRPRGSTLDAYFQAGADLLDPTKRAGLAGNPANVMGELAGKPANSTGRLAGKPANGLAGKPANSASELAGKPANFEPPLKNPPSRKRDSGRQVIRARAGNSEPVETAADLESPQDRDPLPAVLQDVPRRRQSVASRNGIRAGKIEPDAAMLRRCHQFIDTFFPAQNDLHQFVKEYQRVIQNDWLFRALKRCRAKNYPTIGIGLLKTILREWWKLGGPNPGAEDHYDDDMNPLPVPSERSATPPPGSNGRYHQTGPTPIPPYVELTDAERQDLRRRRSASVNDQSAVPGNAGAAVNGALERLRRRDR